MRTRTILWTVGGLLALLAFTALLAAKAQAQTAPESVTVTVDIDTRSTGAPGTIDPLLTLTPADLEAEVGWMCGLVVFGDNGRSTHPDTNIIITSNGDSVTALDVERVANSRTPAFNGTLTLGPSIVISRQVGPDEIASGGLEIQFTCSNQPTTTTTSTTLTEPPATTTTTATTGTTTTSAPPVTTITVPAPTGVNTGGGSADGSGWILAAIVIAVLAGAALIGAFILGANGGRKTDA